MQPWEHTTPHAQEMQRCGPDEMDEEQEVRNDSSSSGTRGYGTHDSTSTTAWPTWHGTHSASVGREGVTVNVTTDEGLLDLISSRCLRRTRTDCHLVIPRRGAKHPD